MILHSIERISVLLIKGAGLTVSNATEAIDFLKNYSDDKLNLLLVEYEIIIRYNTGDKIEATFKDKKNTIKFLEAYL